MVEKLVVHCLLVTSLVFILVIFPLHRSRVTLIEKEQYRIDQCRKRLAAIDHEVETKAYCIEIDIKEKCIPG